MFVAVDVSDDSSLPFLNAIAIVTAPATNIKIPQKTVPSSKLVVTFFVCGVCASTLVKEKAPNTKKAEFNENIVKSTVSEGGGREYSRWMWVNKSVRLYNGFEQL